MFRVNAQAYLIEAGNVRHEHEFKVWRDVKLPAGKILIPGVVSHASDLVEHPELVADHLITFAEIVGQENVIAGTDCGLDGRPICKSPGPSSAPCATVALIASKKSWS
jgi:5-methyltetrahydropteroyltriglutamate--homocysteine methyltransferase